MSEAQPLSQRKKQLITRDNPKLQNFIRASWSKSKLWRLFRRAAASQKKAALSMARKILLESKKQMPFVRRTEVRLLDQAGKEADRRCRLIHRIPHWAFWSRLIHLRIAFLSFLHLPFVVKIAKADFASLGADQAGRTLASRCSPEKQAWSSAWQQSTLSTLRSTINTAAKT